MKKSLSIDDAKNIVQGLLGRNVDIKLNRGRNKIKRYKGVVSEAHTNVFVINLTNDIFDRISCSYVDLICGEIALKEHTSSGAV